MESKFYSKLWFFVLSTKLPCNKPLMILNNLIFTLMEKEKIYYGSKLWCSLVIRHYRYWKSRCSVKNGVIKNFAKCNFIKKETLAQVFSCEFCEIYKSTFYYRTTLVAASDVLTNFAILEPFSNKVAGLF